MGPPADVRSQRGIQVGDVAPDFTLKQQDGRAGTLSELLRDKAVMLSICPKDETADCTAWND